MPLPPRIARLVALAVGLGGAAAAPLMTTGCGGGQVSSESLSPGPPIPGLNLSGRWYSQDFGDMELTQTGPKVMGRYEHPRGPEHNGTIRGDVVGDVLRIEWIQPGDTAAAVFPIKGRAAFRIAQDGKSIDGRWGYDLEDSSGGPWKAEKSKY